MMHGTRHSPNIEKASLKLDLLIAKTLAGRLFSQGFDRLAEYSRAPIELRKSEIDLLSKSQGYLQLRLDTSRKLIEKGQEKLLQEIYSWADCPFQQSGGYFLIVEASCPACTYRSSCGHSSLGSSVIWFAETN